MGIGREMKKMIEMIGMTEMGMIGKGHIRQEESRKRLFSSCRIKKFASRFVLLSFVSADTDTSNPICPFGTVALRPVCHYFQRLSFRCMCPCPARNELIRSKRTHK